MADKNGEMIRRIDLPYYCNHYHANNDNTLLVGDTAEDVVLIDIGGNGQPAIQTLCTHQTSWYSPTRHCHPTFGWQGGKILFESDRSGNQHLYLVELD